jgi:hypothetical protein
MMLFFSKALASPCRSSFVLASLLWLLLCGQAHAQVFPPTAMDDTGVTTDMSPVTVYVLCNDSGGTYPIDWTSVEIVSQPVQGSVSVTSNGSAVIYTPVAGETGMYTFLYSVRDTQGNPSYPAQVWIQVSHDAPTTTDDSAMVVYNQSVVVDVLANDTPGASPIDPTSVVIVTQPTRGSVSVNPATGAVTYTPSGTASGSDSFQYRVSDQLGFVSNISTVSVTVTNNPPQLLNFATAYQGGHFVLFEGNISDENPTSCTVHLGLDLDLNITPEPDGSFALVKKMTGDMGQVNAQATDSAGQQSGTIMAWYFCQF